MSAGVVSQSEISSDQTAILKEKARPDRPYSYMMNRNLWERFLELSLFYGLSSPLNSEMICIFPYFLTLCGISKGNKGNFYLVVACHFIKKSGGVPLCLSCRVGVDIHCGTDIRVP